MKQRFLLVAGGVDKKGIVYNLTKVLKKYNFNIEDSSMVMLRRTFSVIMLLSARDMSAMEPFKKEIKVFSGKYSMTMEINKVTEREMKEYGGQGRKYMISISGADKPGIVNAITGILYKAGANILDLETKSSEKVKPHAYYMMLEVDLPKTADSQKLKAALVKAGKKLGVHTAMTEAENSIL